MKIWVNKKTGETYPDRGGNFACYEKDMSKPKLDIFIRGIGWKKYPSKNWETKDIPDMFDMDKDNYDDTIKLHPSIFRAYVKEFGKNIAAAQLPCCDYIKSIWATVLLDPDYPNDDIQKWFYQTFNKHGDPQEYPEYFKKKIWDLMVSQLSMGVGKYVFDIMEFEKHLIKEFGYDLDAGMSMSDFIIQKFGQENHDVFKNKLLTSYKGSGKVAA